MTFDHKVKYNGKWYMPGEEITEGAERSVSSDFSNYMNKPETKYTKTEIYRMPVAELRKTALNIGVEKAESMTGTELKEYLINFFDL